MGKISHLKSNFFRDNIIYNPNEESNYGLVPFEMNEGASDLVLKEAMDYGVEVKASTSNVSASHIRKVDAWVIPNDKNESIAGELLSHAIIDLNKVFNYKLSHIGEIQYFEYHAEDGHKYDWHIDIDSGVASSRKISISWVLNTGFEGGDLKFFSTGGEILTYNSTPTKLVSFTSFLNHSVTPVTKGVRKVLVAWVYGQNWS
jgi:PKHD-type hydroxylase